MTNNLDYCRRIIRELEPKALQDEVTCEKDKKLGLNARADCQEQKIWIGERLLKESSRQELKAVLAHELGHLALRPMSKREIFPDLRELLLLVVLGVLAFFAWNPFINALEPLFSFWNSLHLPEMFPSTDFQWFPLFIGLLFLFGRFIFKVAARQDLQADLLSGILTQDPKELRNALEKYSSILKHELAEKGVLNQLLFLWARPLAKHEQKQLNQRIQNLKEYESVQLHHSSPVESTLN